MYGEGASCSKTLQRSFKARRYCSAKWIGEKRATTWMMDGDRIEQIFPTVSIPPPSFYLYLHRSSILCRLVSLSLSLFSLLSIILTCIRTVETAIGNQLFNHNFFFISNETGLKFFANSPFFLWFVW